MERFHKQPNEKFPIAADFSAVLAENESIDGNNSSVVAEDENGTDVSSSVLVSSSMTVDGPRLIVTVTGGDAGKRYKITFRCHTTTGNIYELDVQMIVNER